MRKLILATVLAIAAFTVIIISGDRYKAEFDIPYGSDGDYEVLLIQDSDVIEITDDHPAGDKVVVEIQSVSSGKAEIQLLYSGELCSVRHFYVHRFGLITADNYFGDCTNGKVILMAFNVFLVSVIIDLILKFRRNVKEDFYNYRNVSYLAIIIYLTVLLVNCSLSMFSAGGIVDSLMNIIRTADTFSVFMLPAAFLVFLLIGVNNVRLTVKEGVSRNNVMGIIFCLLLCLALMFPRLLDEFLQMTQLIDVHREFGAGHFFNEVSVNIISIIVSYIVCILIATAVMGAKALRQTQHYNRNYIIILGCQIRKDGTLTPLLKGRVDAAMDFARRQIETTGLEPVFVPSGGKGADEVIAEAEAMHDYLVSSGISEDRILVEDRSTDTRENFRFSMDKIREHAGEKKIRIVFATTSYHVLRAGLHAAELGINARGIGSRTKFYFSSNAFIRECIAMLHYERRTHIKIMIMLCLAVLAGIGFVFMANLG